MLAPYHDRDGFIWMNGEFLPWRDAKIHLLTHSLHYGSCVFEGERAVPNLKVFLNGTRFRKYARYKHAPPQKHKSHNAMSA
jgi:branched-subunit amino acid aminotransferase/4-amino-4-deoxychorismate lyase